MWAHNYLYAHVGLCFVFVSVSMYLLVLLLIHLSAVYTCRVVATRRVWLAAVAGEYCHCIC